MVLLPSAQWQQEPKVSLPALPPSWLATWPAKTRRQSTSHLCRPLRRLLRPRQTCEWGFRHSHRVRPPFQPGWPHKRRGVSDALEQSMRWNGAKCARPLAMHTSTTTAASDAMNGEGVLVHERSCARGWKPPFPPSHSLNRFAHPGLRSLTAFTIVLMHVLVLAATPSSVKTTSNLMPIALHSCAGRTSSHGSSHEMRAQRVQRSQNHNQM